MERVHQVIFNIIVSKDFDKKVFDYIYPWGETLTSIAWAIRAYYHHTIGTTSAQAVFGRDMVFNLVSDVDLRVILARKQRQVDIYCIRKNAKLVRFIYVVSDLVHVYMTNIYRKLYYKNKGRLK